MLRRIAVLFSCSRALASLEQVHTVQAACTLLGHSRLQQLTTTGKLTYMLQTCCEAEVVNDDVPSGVHACQQLLSAMKAIAAEYGQITKLK